LNVVVRLGGVGHSLPNFWIDVLLGFALRCQKFRLSKAA
jgi:hypothetical protein